MPIAIMYFKSYFGKFDIPLTNQSQNWKNNETENENQLCHSYDYEFQNLNVKFKSKISKNMQN